MSPVTTPRKVKVGVPAGSAASVARAPAASRAPAEAAGVTGRLVARPGPALRARRVAAVRRRAVDRVRTAPRAVEPEHDRSALTALILSGGGARGAYECGVYQSLVDHGIEPDVLVGTSVGAVNAVAIAQGTDPKTLADIWLSLATRDTWLYFDRLKKARVLLGNRHVFRNRFDVWNMLRWTSIYDTTPFRRTLARCIEPEKLKTSKKRVIITAVDLVKGECRSFANEQITVDHVLASASIPILFPWTRIGSSLYWDGGLLANVPPIKAAIDADERVKRIFVVKLFAHEGPRPRDLVECIERAIEITVQGTLNADIKQCRFINELLSAGHLPGRYRAIDLHTIELKEPFEALSVINFTRGHVEHLMQLGRADTDEYLRAHGLGR